ncbi:MAG: DUF3847 domain-containing protein [Oscillospiraceae bacterium]|nr:DUF3847 domain-containing protein [Oscillospiraceae bacterium]
MRKTKTQKRLSVKEQIRQLENKRKQLIQKEKSEERKARTKRLIERGVIAESLIANADTLTNEQFKAVLVEALNVVLDKPEPAEAESVSGSLNPLME